MDLGGRAASAFGPYRPMRGGGDRLDAEYASGEWDYLRGDAELPRFGVVAICCTRFAGGGRILEVGCGEGVLAGQLVGRCAGYGGVDVASPAMARARGRRLRGFTFVAGDAAVLTPDGLFDVIVFNEVLEYFRDPLGLVRRYEPALSDGGTFIVSQFLAPDNARTRRIWRMLHPLYAPELQTRVSTGPRLAWRIEVLRPRAQLPPAA